MDIFLTNNLSNKKEHFVPKEKKSVGMYVCGPTVYDDPHIGNARPLVIFDILFKLLKHEFPSVTYVTIGKLFFKILKRISKIIRGLALPICGSSYTVGPQTYIPTLSFFIGMNCSLLLIKLFVKKISISLD